MTMDRKRTRVSDWPRLDRAPMERLLRATVNTWHGLIAATRSEEAFRQELVALVLAVPLAFLLAGEAWKRLALIGVVVFVLVVELLNTAIEKLADRVNLAVDPQIGRVKDMGSAAVGLALLIAAVTWLLALAERLGLICGAGSGDCRAPARRARPTPMNARPTDRLAIAVAQLNPIVGDIAGNADKARQARAQAARAGADLVALPELFLSGYPPEDLALTPALQAACRAKIEELARDSADGGPALLIGTPWLEHGKLYNAYCLLDGGAIAAVRLKVNLPNYGVFDERRVFAPGPPPGPVNFRGVRIGMPICEDIWTEWGDYEDVVECLAETGAELMIVPNGSPYSRDKDDVRLNIAVARVTESDLPLVYVNQVGGQDELVFDGASFGLHADRSLAFQLPAFREAVETLVWERSGNGWRCSGGPVAALEEGDKADYLACMLGLRDYVNKSGFKGVVLGLSGGIDSALVAA